MIPDESRCGVVYLSSLASTLWALATERHAHLLQERLRALPPDAGSYAMSQQPQAVRTYRLYLLDDSDHIVKAREVEAGSDEEAAELAAEMLQKEARAAVEVWDRARRVCR